MTEDNPGTQKDRPYRGENGVITYNLERCLHAAECTRGLPAVFDNKKRPWIMPDGAPADQIMEVIQRCPSGALHMLPVDKSLNEAIPDKNIIHVENNGYLRIVGNLEIRASHVTLHHETRAALCRCGASNNKPFCDNTHLELGFTTLAPSLIQDDVEDDDAFSGPVLLITATQNGPLEIHGNFEIHDTHGNLIHTGTHTWLCRCGHSNRKPFCDTSHRRIGFIAP